LTHGNQYGVTAAENHKSANFFELFRDFGGLFIRPYKLVYSGPAGQIAYISDKFPHFTLLHHFLKKRHINVKSENFFSNDCFLQLFFL